MPNYLHPAVVLYGLLMALGLYMYFLPRKLPAFFADLLDLKSDRIRGIDFNPVLPAMILVKALGIILFLVGLTKAFRVLIETGCTFLSHP